MSEHKLTAELVQQFSENLLQEERASGTIQNYLRDVAAFLQWLDGRPVTAGAASRWKRHLLSSGLAAVTVNCKLAALNSFFRFLGWVDCRVQYLRLQRRAFRDSSRELVREEYIRLLSAARERGRERLPLLLETICATGIRVSEVRYITVEAARSRRADISLKGKIRTLLLPARLCRKLLKFAKKQGISSGEIFVTRTGKSLSRNQIWREMKDLCGQAGVAASKVFPHNLRHLFAVVFYRVCRDIVKLADLLGHSSINTTRIYLQSTGAEHIRQMEKLGLVT